MTRILKENLVLTAGLALPVALMVLFFAAGRWSESSTADPQYSLVFAASYDERWSNQPWTLDSAERFYQARALLFVSAVGLLAYLSYFAYEYFADVVGWPIALIALGLAMLGVGGWVMKLSRRIQQA